MLAAGAGWHGVVGHHVGWRWRRVYRGACTLAPGEGGVHGVGQ
jgi:hypothetical protein